ncbi:MAG: Rieske 2Fe-2S domain-containing protein [Caldilineaceae bacterium]
MNSGEHVQRAQQMAAERLGVDAAVMLPPRQPDGGGAAAHQAEAEPVAVEVAQPEAVAAVETPAEAAPAAGTATPAPAESSAAQRIAEAKARAATKGSNGGPATAAAPKPAAPPAPAPAASPEEEEVGQQGINRREFITYAWGAALGLLTLEIGVGSYYFMYPRFRAGEFGGAFPLSQGELPPPEAAPNSNTTGKFWLVDTADGPRALYMVCTHLGCLYKWEESNFRFECPCHGSKFDHDGHYIEGPAPRSLDQFVIDIVQNGEVVGSTEDGGDNIIAPQIPGPDAQIVVQTGQRIMGKPAADSPARVG